MHENQTSDLNLEVVILMNTFFILKKIMIQLYGSVPSKVPSFNCQTLWLQNKGSVDGDFLQKKNEYSCIICSDSDIYISIRYQGIYTEEKYRNIEM